MGGLVTILTLGICYPWAFCMVYRWETKHAAVNGHRRFSRHRSAAVRQLNQVAAADRISLLQRPGRPDCRGRGIGTELLRLGLEEARKLGLDRVMLFCRENNPASRKVIEANGGGLSERAVLEGSPLLVFWISLSGGNPLSSQ